MLRPRRIAHAVIQVARFTDADFVLVAGLVVEAGDRREGFPLRGRLFPDGVDLRQQAAARGSHAEAFLGCHRKDVFLVAGDFPFFRFIVAATAQGGGAKE